MSPPEKPLARPMIGKIGTLLFAAIADEPAHAAATGQSAQNADGEHDDHRRKLDFRHVGQQVHRFVSDRHQFASP
jgi:hypothetical protein